MQSCLIYTSDGLHHPYPSQDLDSEDEEAYPSGYGNVNKALSLPVLPRWKTVSTEGLPRAIAVPLWLSCALLTSAVKLLVKVQELHQERVAGQRANVRVDDCVLQKGPRGTVVSVCFQERQRGAADRR